MNELFDFVNTELLEAVHPHAAEVFPEMEFVPYSKGWRSRLHLDGTASHSKDQTTYNAAAPYCFSDWNGKTIGVISYVRDRYKLSWIEAVKYLAEKAGIDLPKLEPANVAQFERRQTQAQQLKEFLYNARILLHTPEGTEALVYLQNVRHYDFDFINFAEFGIIDAAAVARLKVIIGYDSPDYKGSKTLFDDIEKTHPLVFPFRNRGRLLGLIFRTIGDAEPKYLDLFVDKAEAKAAHFFGLNAVRLNSEKNDLVIVEGELDALRAQYHGFRNVVAASGGFVGEFALQEVKRMGAKKITILFDTERKDNAKGQEETYVKVERAIRAIQKAELEAYVTFLPSTPDGCKVDADSYFRTNTPEAFADVIKSDNTASANKYFFERAASAYKADVKKFGTDADKPLRSFVNRIFDIYTDTNTQPYERNQIAKAAAILTGGVVTAEAIEAQAGALKVTRDAERQKNELIKLTQQANEQARKGDIAATFATLEKSNAVKDLDRAAEFAELDKRETREERRARRKRQTPSLPTSFKFLGTSPDDNGDKWQPFELPTKALTFVGAQTSHGKSRFLQNLAVDQAKRNTDGVNLYISLEEDKTDVERELLNIYAGVHLSNNNLKTIKSYHISDTDTHFCKDAKRGTANYAAFTKAEAEFEELLDADRLKVLDTEKNIRDVNTLCAYIRHKAQTCKLNAVFVDYVQLIAGGKTDNKKNELEQICIALMETAKQTGTAIVLAAQLNRQALSPTEMSCQNLADASNIEHNANTVVLLWNSSVKAITGQNGSKEYPDGITPKSETAKTLHRRGLHLGEGGKLYAELAKSRVGERGINAVLAFNQNTGVISNTKPQNEQATTAQPSTQINNNHLLK